MSSAQYAVGNGFDNGGAVRAASGCNVRAPHIRSIEIFITIIETTDNGRIHVNIIFIEKLKSQVWGSLTLAQLRKIPLTNTCQ